MYRQIKSTSFASFRRQLALYDIKRKKNTKMIPSFSHILLKRGRSDLLKQIKRLRQTGTKTHDQVNSALLELCRSRLNKRMNDSNEVKSVNFKLITLNFIQEVDRYNGKGIAAFFKKFVQQINYAFPNIKSQICQQIKDTERILYSKNNKNSMDRNKKANLIKFINTFLTKLDDDFRWKKNYKKVPLNFDDYKIYPNPFKNILPKKAHNNCALNSHETKPSKLFIPKYPETSKFKQ